MFFSYIHYAMFISFTCKVCHFRLYLDAQLLIPGYTPDFLYCTSMLQKFSVSLFLCVE